MSNDVFDTAAAFIAAAGSYFGIPDEQVMTGSGVDTSQGTFEVVLRVALTPDDLAGVAQRMKAMQDAKEQAPEPASDLRTPVGWTREELREQYNALPKQERSQFGSFHNYCLARGGADPYAVTSTVELPAHVYLSPAECTPQQKAMAIGRDEKGNYAIAVEDLTEEQIEQCGYDAAHVQGAADQLRQAYVERTVAAHARLNGADGKPTSNADDFGGLPG